jgi:hypothetical protein
MDTVRLPNGERVCWEKLAVVREFLEGFLPSERGILEGL